MSSIGVNIGNEAKVGAQTKMDSTTANTATDSTPVVISCVHTGIDLVGKHGNRTILEDVSLDVRAGEFVSILGKSGSGKTTLLRALAGLQNFSSGNITFRGDTVVAPCEGVVMVFQDYASSLLPWRTVRRNVALGVERSLTAAETRQRTDEVLQIVGLTTHADEYPWRLSGGMQQRVQIARALALKPAVLLMDEPFGALDAMTKATLQDQLQEIQTVTGTTIVFITHDVEEAVYLSDRVVTLHGTPASLGLDLRIDLTRPRHQVSTRESAEYLGYRHAVYEALEHGAPA